MKRVVVSTGGLHEVPEIDSFMSEIEVICRKHNLCLGHEDHHGAFTIHEFEESTMEWVKDAHDARETGNDPQCGGMA